MCTIPPVALATCVISDPKPWLGNLTALGVISFNWRVQCGWLMLLHPDEDALQIVGLEM